MMLHAIENTVLHFDEGMQLYKFMHKETNKTASILLKILPLLQKPEDVRNMLAFASDNDRMQLSQLKQALGYSYGPLCGQYDGYYRYDGYYYYYYYYYKVQKFFISSSIFFFIFYLILF